MKYWIKSLSLMTAFCAVAVGFGQDIALEIKGDTKTVKVDKVIIVKEDLLIVNALPFTVSAPPGAILYSWDIPAGVVATKHREKLEVTAAPQGPITISVEAGYIDFEKKVGLVKSGTIKFNYGGVTPPPPPDPPGPAPGPSPIPLDGFRVVVVYDKLALTADQEAIIYGAEVRADLESRCVLDPESKTKAYWIIPKGSDVTKTPSWVRDVIQKHPGASNWVVISNGNGKLGGYDGVIPATKQEAMNLLKKIGG